VPGYPGDQVELVAAVHVRTALGLNSGDILSITAGH
jgi:CTP-dependent riboflavin kinase